MEEYDDYYEEGDGQYAYEDDYEEEVVEEEQRKPSAEELEYLEFRQKIKEQIRKKMQRNNGSKSSQNKRLPSDDYGSFFGPSQPVIAQRVIEESKPLLENPRVAARLVNGYKTNVKEKINSTSTSAGRGHDHAPRAKKEVQMKVQQLKNTRDYSFLENMEIPGPSNEPKRHFAPPSKSFIPSQPSRNPQPSQKVKPPNAILQRTKPIRPDNQNLSKSEPSKPRGMSNSTSGPLDPGKQSAINARKPQSITNVASKVNPSNQRSGIVQKTNGVSNSQTHKNSLSSAGKSGHQPLIKPQLSANQRLEMKRPVEELRKRPMPDKSEVNRQKQNPPSVARNNDRMKKRPVRPSSDDEDAQALQEIRKMFNTRRFAGRDDDDSDMEANFDDILREERRSAKIGRKEDEEQLRLIEEEERREQMRKMAKKRKF